MLNLVVVVDREWRGEILNRLERVGRYHPSRLILCAVEPGRTDDRRDGGDHDRGRPGAGRAASWCASGSCSTSARATWRSSNTIVDPLVVTDIATVTWSPHGHPEAVDALLHLAQVVLVDSVNESDARSAVTRAQRAGRRTPTWSTWPGCARRRGASGSPPTFDPPQWRDELGRINSVTVQPPPRVGDGRAAVLRLARGAAGLGARVAGERQRLAARQGPRAPAGRGSCTLEPDPTMSVPGLAGVDLGTASGMRSRCTAGPGGLTARRRDRKGNESTLDGARAPRAARSGILGEGIRQALLRDPTYAAALERAAAMVG